MSSNLFRSSGVVSLMTLISRLLGFVRDVLQASLFGAGAAMDVFFVAFRIPNLFRRLFAAGAFQQAFVPVLTETRNTRSPAEVRALVDVVSGTLGGFLLLFTAVAVIAAPLLMGAFAPGFADDPEKFEQGVRLLRWTFPYLMFMSLAALVSGILNAYGKFAIPALTPVWLNIVMIAAALLYAPSVEALAIAVFFAGIVQLLFQLPAVAKLGLLPRPRWGWHDPQVRRIITLMIPIVFGASVQQVSLLLDSIIASFLPGQGSVSWLWFADRLMEFPLGTFSIAIATVILPSLAGHHARNSAEEFSDTLDWALRAVVLLGLPATVGLFVLAGPIVSTLFQHSEFTVTDVGQTAWALMAYALGFLGFSFVKILIPGFYARQQTRAPIRFGVIALVCGMLLSAGFTLSLLAMDFVAPHAGIALATAISAWINACLLARALYRERVWCPRREWRVFLLRVGIANLVMAMVLAWTAGSLEGWTSAPAMVRAGRLAATIVAAAVAYFALLYAMGMRPARYLRRT